MKRKNDKAEASRVTERTETANDGLWHQKRQNLFRINGWRTSPYIDF